MTQSNKRKQDLTRASQDDIRKLLDKDELGHLMVDNITISVAGMSKIDVNVTKAADKILALINQNYIPKATLQEALGEDTDISKLMAIPSLAQRASGQNDLRGELRKKLL